MGADLEVDYVSARALELSGCADESAFRRAWQGHEPALRRALDGDPTRPGGGSSLLVEAAPGRPVQAELHRLGGPAEDYLVLLRDPRAVEVLRPTPASPASSTASAASTACSPTSCARRSAR